MTEYVISGIPVAWTSHRGYGKKSFNPHHMEKLCAKQELEMQHGERPLYQGIVRADFFFEMPIPLSFPKKFTKRIQAGEKIYHTKRPDRTNLLKHAEDCLTGSILHDDNIVALGIVEKYYSLKPQTKIIITPLEEV